MMSLQTVLECEQDVQLCKFSRSSHDDVAVLLFDANGQQSREKRWKQPD